LAALLADAMHSPAMLAPLTIRTATEADLPVINAIYNHYVLHCTCTYQTEPSTAAERQAWFEAHGEQHPIIVAERAGTVIGWGSLSRFHEREAYRHTVEDSIYVHHDSQRTGVGSALLAELLRRAQQLGHHSIIGGIDTEQTGSLALHESFGFIRVAHYREVGHKFGRWLDVIRMQRML
jgi:L-amino acid N-acyltransferase